MTYQPCATCNGTYMLEETREYEDRAHGRIRRVTVTSACPACQLGCASYDSSAACCRDCSPADRACERKP